MALIVGLRVMRVVHRTGEGYDSSMSKGIAMQKSHRGTDALFAMTTTFVKSAAYYPGKLKDTSRHIRWNRSLLVVSLNSHVRLEQFISLLSLTFPQNSFLAWAVQQGGFLCAHIAPKTDLTQTVSSNT